MENNDHRNPGCDHLRAEPRLEHLIATMPAPSVETVQSVPMQDPTPTNIRHSRNTGSSDRTVRHCRRGRGIVMKP